MITWEVNQQEALGMVFDLVLTNRDPLGLPLVTQGILGGQLACLISNLSPTARHYNTALSFSLSVYASKLALLASLCLLKFFRFSLSYILFSSSL